MLFVRSTFNYLETRSPLAVRPKNINRRGNLEPAEISNEEFEQIFRPAKKAETPRRTAKFGPSSVKKKPTPPRSKKTS